MKTYLYDEEQRRTWVQLKYTKAKTVRQICKEAGISRATLYNWIKEFPDTSGADDAAGTELSPGIPQPVTIESATRYRMLLSVLGAVDPDKVMARKMVALMVKRYTLTVAQACAIVGIDEETYGYKPRKPEVDDEDVYNALVALINDDRSRGFDECYGLLLRSHPGWTRKQIRRVYKERRVFQLRKRVRKIVTETKSRLYFPGGSWSLGLVQGATGTLGNYWITYITDTNDGVLLNAATGSGNATAMDVAAFLSLAALENGVPRKLRIPGIAPFTERDITQWAWNHKTALHTLSLNKPENQQEVDNVQIRIHTLLPVAQAQNIDELKEMIEDRLSIATKQD